MMGKLVTATDRRKMEAMLSLLNDSAQPNINALTAALANVPLMSFNIKTMGYDLARSIVAALPPQENTQARHVGLRCKPSIQADLESDWAAHWLAQLRVPLVMHRKLWELAYILQAIYEEGHLRPDARGLGFGCGVEPLPSYFASHGAAITMTDLAPEKAAELGWTDSNQHTATRQLAFHSDLVSQDVFDEKVSLRYVDMNAIPDDLSGFDFCWSVCALEHLGSIDNGLRFVEESMRTLRPGGLSVHTTELNISSEGPTIDNWPTVLFQRRHIEALAARLRAQGHYVAELDFFLGDKPMDRFIDLPPFHHDLPADIGEWLGDPLHMKVAVDGFASTCFGLLVRKAA